MTPAEHNTYNAFQSTRQIGQIVTWQKLLNSVPWSIDRADDAQNVIQLLIDNGALEKLNGEEYIWL